MAGQNKSVRIMELQYHEIEAQGCNPFNREIVIGEEQEDLFVLVKQNASGCQLHKFLVVAIVVLEAFSPDFESFLRAKLYQEKIP